MLLSWICFTNVCDSWFLLSPYCFVLMTVATNRSLQMFGQQGAMPQFPRMFGGDDLRQPGQFTVTRQ